VAWTAFPDARICLTWSAAKAAAARNAALSQIYADPITPMRHLLQEIVPSPFA
jgi:hypothetical protein